MSLKFSAKVVQKIMVIFFIFLQFFVMPVGAIKPNKNIFSASFEVSQEKTLHQMVNKERKKNGLAPLVVWDVLSDYAKQHSLKMASGQVAFGHTGFKDRSKVIHKHSKCHSVGENVAYCFLIQDPLQTSLDLWMKSPDHCENILGDYCESGIGIAYNKEGYCYITQLFSKRVSLSFP